MGSGKTSIGKKLAKQLNLEIFDLDQFIEEKYNQSISEIFEVRGELEFRKMEFDSLLELSKKKNCVIALGGGTPCFEKNMKLIKSSGTSIYLKLDKAILIGRLRLKKAKRPLIANLNDEAISKLVHQKLNEREAFYNQADYTLENNHPKAKMILECLKLKSI